MAANTLLLTLLSGLVLVGLVVVILQLRSWRQEPTAGVRSRSLEASVTDALRSPTTWVVGFSALVLIAVAGTLAVVGAIPVPESAQSAVGTALVAVAAAVLGSFVFAGVYASVRNRGHGSAPAAGLGSFVLGVIVLVVVVLRLFLG